MIRVFSSQSLAEVEMFRGMLEENGVESTVRNKYLSIGKGEIPFTEAWPELWVLRDEDAAPAQAVLAGGRNGVAADAWTCPGCGEEIEGQFTSCWNCGASCSPE